MGRINPAGCRVLEVNTSTYHYKSRRPAQATWRTGSRRSARRGFATAAGACMYCCGVKVALSQNKTRRIYRELGLQLRNETPKRRVKAKLRFTCESKNQRCRGAG